MRCNDITQEMSEALDGQLDPTRQAALDAHLAECPACREGCEALRETVEHLQGLEPLTPPPCLIVDINAAIDRPQGFRVHGNVFSSPPVRVALAASFVVVVGLLGIRHLNLTPRDTATAVREAPAAPRPAPADGRQKSVVMPEETAAGEDDVVAPEEAESTMAPREAEAVMARAIAEKRRQESRALDPGATQKGVVVPAVAASRLDRDALVWAEPAPEGVVGGLRVGDEARASSEAGQRRVVHSEGGAALKYRADAEAAEAPRPASPSRPVRVVHIRVTGLARDVVLQAAEAPVDEQGAADSKKETSRVAAQSVAEGRVVAPKPDMMQEGVVDRVMSAVDTSASRREGEAVKDKPETDDIVLHLSPGRLAFFLTRLRALDEDLAVSTLPTNGAAGELIEIRVRLVP